MLNLLRKITPRFVRLMYHFLWGALSCVYYRFPSRKVVVIGVTGTKGKTSTCVFIHTALSVSGVKSGMISTAETRIGDKVIPNTMHMTTPGRGYISKKIREMVNEGCEAIVLEISSEGIYWFRDFGVWYDAMVFTNLSPEHLKTHKTFENYKATKGRVFRKLAKQKVKCIDGGEVPRISLTNADDMSEPYFCSMSGDVECIRFGLGRMANYRGKILDKGTFIFNKYEFKLKVTSKINVLNAMPAIMIAERYAEYFNISKVGDVFSKVALPGRLEKIEEGQDFIVFVDYAHEPLSIRESLKASQKLTATDGKVILVVGGVGDGRYVYNAHDIGREAADGANVIFVTDVDPYYDDPKEIALKVVEGIGPVEFNRKLIVDLDRRSCICQALEFAKDGDVVLITGKGAEQTYIKDGKALPWNEREIVREELRRILRERQSVF